MTIILFLIDTSASMSQEAYVNGVHKTYLDIAKGAVETFLKYRQRSQDCLGDRYMLLTFEDPPSNIKAGWKENHATFMNELKNLQSNGLTSMGDALKSAFDLLNLNRMQSGIDTYGQGRCPFYLEPSIIILITDGGKFSFRNGVSSEFVLPININIPGFKLTKEPFRWDQRLFSLVLRMSGNKGDERIEGTNTWKVPHDDSAIEKMCEVTGGRSYRVRTQYVLNQCIESLVQKAQPGVVVNFESIVNKELKDGEVQDLMFQNTKKMIYVHKIPALKSFPVGYWPIPESYFPDVKMSTLPPRDAHPRIKIISPCQDEPQTVRNFPIDKYELEASPLTLQILSRKDPNKVWPLLVVNSNNGAAPPMPSYRYDEAPSSYRGNATNDMPFGYLKAHNSLTVVHFYVLPYNYQFLLPLISDLVHKLNNNPTSEWINKFATYVKNMPQYYVPFLRRALTMINIPYQLLQYILPESLDNYLSAAVANSLKQMKNKAKIEQESLCLHVFKQLKLPRQPYHQHETVKLNCGLPLKITDLVRHPMLKDTFQKLHSEINTYDNYNIVVPTVMSIQSTKNYRNPFDIPRRDLIDEISRMRDNFFKLPTCNINLVTKDAGHSLPIAEMGNYQEYLKRRETPLRELEPTNVRQHMFGNPYKRDKHMVMVDEADVHEMASDPSSMNNKSIAQAKKDIRMSRKRKAGPIRKDYIYKRARFDFGYPMSPGLPCAPSPLSSDAEDDSASESGSMFTDDNDDSRSMSDFSEISNDEYRMNGHMQEYGAGFEMHDPNDMPMEPTTPPPPLPAPFVHTIQPTPIVSRQPNYSINHQQPPSQLNNNSPHFLGSHHFNQQTPPIGSTPVLPLPLSLNGDMAALQIPAIGSPVVQPVPTSPTTPPPPFPTVVTPATSSSSSSSSSTILSSRLLNDMNDVQNISNILKTCQNGSGSSKGGSHHNNNSSHDKFSSRLENDSCDRLTNNNNNSNNCNSKEINENSIDDKLVKSEDKPPTTGRQQHRQSKVKSLPTSKSNSKSSSSSSSSSATTTTTTSVPATTNGLVNNRSAIDVKSKNCLKSVNLNHTNNKTTSNNNSSNNNNNNNNSNNNNSSKTTTTIKSSALLPVENGDDTETLDGEEIKTQNQETRTIVFKDIRKYGRDYGSLYEHLGLVKGNFDTRFNFIQMCIDEATRFRRKRMADCIQEWWDNSLDKVSKSKT